MNSAHEHDIDLTLENLSHRKGDWICMIYLKLDSTQFNLLIIAHNYNSIINVKY